MTDTNVLLLGREAVDGNLVQVNLSKTLIKEPIMKEPTEKRQFDGIIKELTKKPDVEKQEAVRDDMVANKSESKQPTEQTKQAEQTEQPTEQVATDQNASNRVTQATEQEDTQEVVMDDEVLVDLMGQINAMMTQILTEKLQVSPEELQAALSELELSMSDLFDTANLAEVFQFFETDMPLVDLLVDPEFQEVMSQFQQLTDQVAEVLDIDLEAAMKQFETLQKTDDVIAQDVVVDVSEETSADIKQAQEMPEPVKEVKETAATPIRMTSETEEVVVSTENELPEETIVPVKETAMEQSGQEEQQTANSEEEELPTPILDKQDNTVEKKTDVTHTTVSATHVENHAVVTPEGDVAIEQSVKVVDLQNLVNELTEYVRVQAGNHTVSSIEMQMNPMNLGKMFVEITSQQGEITAKIATQTEAAKEAMEANVTQLKENLEQQGIKVSAVEVTLESHGFEQNLQEDGSKEQQQLAKEMQRENARMNLNLNEMTLDDLQGLMSEEDMVVAKMMRDNGNTMDIGV